MLDEFSKSVSQVLIITVCWGWSQLFLCKSVWRFLTYYALVSCHPFTSLTIFYSCVLWDITFKVLGKKLVENYAYFFLSSHCFISNFSIHCLFVLDHILSYQLQYLFVALWFYLKLTYLTFYVKFLWQNKKIEHMFGCSEFYCLSWIMLDLKIVCPIANSDNCLFLASTCPGSKHLCHCCLKCS